MAPATVRKRHRRPRIRDGLTLVEGSPVLFGRTQQQQKQQQQLEIRRVFVPQIQMSIVPTHESPLLQCKQR